MAELATIARPYAEAAFQAADAAGQLAAWSASLGELAGVAANADVQKLAGNPQVSAGQLTDVLASMVKAGVSDQVRHFVRMLADARKITLLPEIAGQFEALKNDRTGEIDAVVYSAFPMDEAQVASLAKGLSAKFSRTVKATVEIDRELIGGVKVVVGDRVLDGSVRAKLDALRAGLKA